MSYARQTSEYLPGRPLDFSNYTMTEIDESGPGTALGGYGPIEVTTLVGNSAGDHTIIWTNATVSGDVNKINVVECDGTGTDLISQEDWDDASITLVARTHSNWLDGVNINNPQNQNRGIILPPTPDDDSESCANISQRAPIPSPSPVMRTCVDENYTNSTIRNIRSEVTSFASNAAGDPIPIGADPQPGEDLYCLDQAKIKLDQLKNDPTISPAEAKLILEDLMKQFDGNIINKMPDPNDPKAADDCDGITDAQQNKIFDRIFDVYKRYSIAVPEFGHVVMIILSVSLVAMIAISSKTKILQMRI